MTKEIERIDIWNKFGWKLVKWILNPLNILNLIYFPCWAWIKYRKTLGYEEWKKGVVIYERYTLRTIAETFMFQDTVG